MFAKISLWAQSLARSHRYALFSYQDVIQGDQFDSVQNSGGFSAKIRQHYLAGAGIVLATALYGIFGLEFEGLAGNDPGNGLFEWDHLSASVHPFTHQLFPEPIWRQLDVVIATFVCSIVTSWIGFALQKPIERKFLIDYTKMNRQNLEQLRLFRTRFLRISYWLNASVLLSCEALAYLNVFLLNRVYTVSVMSFVFWLIALQSILCYSTHLVFGIPTYVILASRAIQYRQKYHLKRFTSMNLRLRKFLTLKGRRGQPIRSQLKDSFIWLKYLTINRHIVAICTDLNEYARFWAIYLSILFSCYILLQCYLTYAILFGMKGAVVASWWRALFPLLTVALVGAEVGLIKECACVVSLNRKLLNQNRIFRMCYQNNVGWFGAAVPHRNILKAESLQDSRLLHWYAFRLFGNYRITRKSFHIMVSYTSIFFLFVIKAQRPKKLIQMGSWKLEGYLE